MTAKITRLPIPGIALILIITTLVFGLSLLNDFVWDDWVLMVPNPVYLEFDLKGIFFGLANSVEYLPVRDLSIALDAALWGMKPFGFHLSNLVYYLLSLFVLHRAMIHLGQLFEAREPERLAFWATLLFAVHPLHAEVVNFIGARNSILAGLFLFLSFNLILRSLQENRTGLTWASLACYLLALFSKAIVVFFPVFLAVFLYILPRNVASLKTRFYLLAGFVVITAAAVALHLYFAAQTGAANDDIVRFGIQNPWLQFVKALQIILFYVRMTLVPWPLTVEYPTELFFHGPWLHALLSATLLVLCCVVFWKGKKKSPILALGIAWFLIAFLPVLNFVPTHPVVADRYAFLPLAGCAMIFAVLVTQTGKWTFQTLGLGLAVIVAASGFSLYRTAAWRSDIDLWRSAIKANNNSGRVELAQALWRRDRYQEALEQLEIERDLAGSHYYNFYAGGFAMMNGQTDRAISLFKAALAEGGEAYSDVHLKLAEAYEQAGEPELALEHYLKTLQTENMDFFSRDRQEAQSAIDRIWKEMGPEMATRKRDAVNHPEDFLKQAQAAVYFYSVGKYDDAETFYLSALELAPSSWEAWHNLGLTYMKTLDYDAAINAFRTALEYNPGNTNSLNNLAISYDKTDRQDMAIRTYRRALDADPQFFFAAFNLGRIYFSQGDLDNAREYLLYARSLIASDDPRRRRVALYLSEIGGG